MRDIEKDKNKEKVQKKERMNIKRTEKENNQEKRESS